MRCKRGDAFRFLCATVVPALFFFVVAAGLWGDDLVEDGGAGVEDCVED